MITGCLAADAAERFQTADDVIRALGGEAITTGGRATRSTPVVRQSRQARRVVLGVTTVVVLAGAGWWLTNGRVARDGPVALSAATQPVDSGLVSIAASTYTIGSNSGPAIVRPRHSGRVAAFRIERTEVTVAADEKFVIATRAPWGDVANCCRWNITVVDDCRRSSSGRPRRAGARGARIRMATRPMPRIEELHAAVARLPGQDAIPVGRHLEQGRREHSDARAVYDLERMPARRNGCCHGPATGQGGGHTFFTAKYGSSTAAADTFVNYGSAVSGGNAFAGHTVFSISLPQTTHYCPVAGNGTQRRHPISGSKGPTAGNATIINLGAFTSGAPGGQTLFSGTSSAADAQLIAIGGTNGGSGGRITF